MTSSPSPSPPLSTASSLGSASATPTSISSSSITSALPTLNPTTGGNQNNGGNGTLATSASLYLYTFLATLVLLLSVSAAIVIRSFVLRRRHRLMMEEAIRNGTWVPPAPPTRPVRVDLSKKPVLWEAYIDGQGDLVGYNTGAGAGDGKINEVWKTENSKEWDVIKPIAAAYLTEEGTPYSAPGMPTVSSVGSLRSASAPVSAPASSESPPDLEAANGSAPPASTARHRAILSRALNILNPTPNPTSPLPASLSNAGPNANMSSTGVGEIGMTELKGPKVMRVAVLIAMPSPPGSGSGSMSASATSSTSLSSGPSSSASPLHHLQSSTTHSTLHNHPHDDDDEHPLPHLEMGVADVVVSPSHYHGADTASGLGAKKKPPQRGSLGSVMSEGSEV